MPQATPFAQKKLLEVVDSFSLRSQPLINYLQDRAIPLEVAMRYCNEVVYKLGAKTYYGIGFKTDSGSFEIRNRYFKAASSPKSITTISEGHRQVSVFEGFFDFLSFKTLQSKTQVEGSDAIVLNSLALLNRSKRVFESYEKVSLYLDNDTAGQKAVAALLLKGQKFVDESRRYSTYKDLNDYLVASQKKLRHKVPRLK